MTGCLESLNYDRLDHATPTRSVEFFWWNSTKVCGYKDEMEKEDESFFQAPPS